MDQEQEAPGDQLQVVVFSIEGKALGVDIRKIQEILRMVEITPFPNMPAFALGAINVRGQIVPVINLRKKLNLPDRPPSARTCIMLVRAGTQVVGFLVDAVSEVLELPEAYLEAPEESPSWMRSDLFSGLGKLPGRLIVVINPDRLLSLQEERLLTPPGGETAPLGDAAERKR